MNATGSNAHDAYILGGYEIIATAGAGGMGVVYKGVDAALGRTVAIKVLKDELQAHPAVVARFRREAEAIATLNHPNIVRIYGIGDQDTVPFIAMEYIEGRPLSDILLETGSIPWEEALDIGIQVASALVCAHECQVIHRDIKPANILICEDGTVKVTDFGIAKVLNASTQLTVDGARIGTPQYMCPERCKNLPAQPASDIYSLGVMLFQCITGRLPYDATSAADLISKIAYETPKRIRAYKPETPETVERLIAYMLEKDAANRPPDSRTLRDIIDRVRRGDRVADVLPTLEISLTTVRADTPSPLRASETTVEQGQGFLTAFRHRWFGLSRKTRLLFPLVAMALLIVIIVFLSMARLSRSADIASRYQAHGETMRWTERSELAHFRPETTGVISGTIGLEDFQIDDMRWIDGADGAAILLQGVARTPREGQTTLMTLNPYLRKVNVSLPPIPTTSKRSAFTLLGAGQRSTGQPGMVVTAYSGTYFLSTLPGDTPDSLAPWVGSGAALLVTDQGALLSNEHSDGQTQLIYSDLESSSQKGWERKLEGPLLGLARHATSGRLAILSQFEEATRLEVIDVTAPDRAPVLQRDGDITMSNRPFNTSGDTLIYISSIQDGLGTLVIHPLASGRPMIEQGEAYATLWQPGSNNILLQAPDYAGHRQLWIRDASQPEQRKQLTYLETGLDTAWTVSEDGKFALAALPSSNTFVVVDLMSERDGVKGAL